MYLHCRGCNRPVHEMLLGDDKYCPDCRDRRAASRAAERGNADLAAAIAADAAAGLNAVALDAREQP